MVVAQQNRLKSIAPYNTTLRAQWQAVTDLAGMLQVESLYDVESPGAVLREPALMPPPPAEEAPAQE